MCRDHCWKSLPTSYDKTQRYYTTLRSWAESRYAGTAAQKAVFVGYEGTGRLRWMHSEMERSDGRYVSRDEQKSKIEGFGVMFIVYGRVVQRYLGISLHGIRIIGSCCSGYSNLYSK